MSMQVAYSKCLHLFIDDIVDRVFSRRTRRAVSTMYNRENYHVGDLKYMVFGAIDMLTSSACDHEIDLKLIELTSTNPLFIPSNGEKGYASYSYNSGNDAIGWATNHASLSKAKFMTIPAENGFVVARSDIAYESVINAMHEKAVAFVKGLEDAKHEMFEYMRSYNQVDESLNYVDPDQLKRAHSAADWRRRISSMLDALVNDITLQGKKKLIETVAYTIACNRNSSFLYDSKTNVRLPWNEFRDNGNDICYEQAAWLFAMSDTRYKADSGRLIANVVTHNEYTLIEPTLPKTIEVGSYQHKQYNQQLGYRSDYRNGCSPTHINVGSEDYEKLGLSEAFKAVENATVELAKRKINSRNINEFEVWLSEISEDIKEIITIGAFGLLNKHQHQMMMIHSRLVQGGQALVGF